MAVPETVDEMFAFIATENDGSQGVVAAQTPDGWLPLVGADMARVESLMPLARQLAAQHGYPIEVVRFSHREVIRKVLG